MDQQAATSPQQIPYADDLLPAEVKSSTAGQATGQPQGQTPYAEELLDHPPVDQDYQARIMPAVGRILGNTASAASDAFTQSGKQGAFSQAAHQDLANAGLINAPGESNIAKSAFQTVYDPAAMLYDAVTRPMSAALAAYQTAAITGGQEAGVPALGRDIAMIPEALPQGTHGMSVHLPEDLAIARANNVVGVPEAVYMGTREETPVQASEREQAAAQVTPRAEEPPAEPAAAPDIHQIARNIAPDTFKEYDELDRQKQELQHNIRNGEEVFGKIVDDKISELKSQQDELSRAPVDLEGDELHKAVTDNISKAADIDAQIEELNDSRQAFIDSSVADARQQFQDADYKMRDLSPEVSAAYRTAEDHIAQGTMPSPETMGQSAGAVTETPLAPATMPSPEQHAAIVADVMSKLQAAGRPVDEAEAAAQLVAEHYQARSERFQGQRGTAQEMYERDGANIKAGKGGVKARELAQPARGKIRLATNDAKATITLMKTANASTFIHETGHHWLDELMRDASEENSPEDLRKDAQTVRDWLGNEGGDIETRQHEKFARGFERYMMEGVAPSKGLASVFAKFKNWLTTIYQTVDKLRSPITDDIRDVFNRLLSTKPEKTVIAPDHEPGKMLADIHEADAVHTPPEYAEAEGDRIENEIDRTAKLHDPEVADAIKAAETGSVTETPSSDQLLTDAGQPTGDDGVAEQPGQVTTGGGNAANESGGPPGLAKQAAGDIGPNDRFTTSDRALVDKAGNIRLDNLSTPEDVNKVIRQTASDNGDFMGARRGVVSDAQVLDLADALGMDAETLNTRKIGQSFNAEQIVAARKLLIHSATSVRDAMEKAADGTEADIIAYAEAKARHVMIQEQVAGLTAEAGRALRAFRKLEGSDEAKALGDFLKQATGKDLFQLQEEAKLGRALQTPQQISKFVNDTSKGKLKDAVIEYYVNSLISGPMTHMRYAVGNAVGALWTPLVEVPAASIIGKLKGNADRVYLGEAGAQLYAMGKGSRDGLQAAIAAWRTGNSPLLPMEGKEGASSIIGAPEHAIPGMAGRIINLPSRGVSSIHSFFKTLRYEQNIAGMSYRQAIKEGLDGANMEGRIAQLTKSPTDEMMKSATENALKELYMAPTEYHSAMGALTRFTNQSLPAKIIIPFMKIGSQITRNAFLERTPLGFLDNQVRSNLLGVNGPVARDIQAAKIMGGTALIATSVMMALEGNMTGDGPTDPKQRAVWLLNHKPNSFQVGNITIPYQGLGSLGMLMRFSANMAETAHGWGEQDGSKLAVAGLEGITKSVLDDNFMRGVKDLLDAVYHPEEYGDRYLQGFATNWLPFSVGLGQVDRMQDPYRRQIHSEGISNAFGIMDAARAKVPYLSEALMPRRDMFGNPMKNGSGYEVYKSDPVVQRLEALHVGVGTLGRKINGVDLTDQQYDDYSRIAGKMTHMMLANIIQPGFEMQPAGMQIKMIDKAIETARETARNMVKFNPANNNIIRQAAANKQAIFNK